MFSKETYLRRRTKLMKLMGAGKVIFPGLSLPPRNYLHNTYPFRQDSSFLYYFGLQNPDLVGVIDCDQRETFIYGEEYSLEEVVWTGPQTPLHDLCDQVGAKFRPLSELQSYTFTKESTHFLPTYRAEQREILSTIVDTRSNASVALIKAVVSQRSKKSEEELKELDHAVTVTGKLHREVMAHAKEGVTERELVAQVHRVLAEENSLPSFQPILTTDGETLHNHHHSNTLKKGDPLLCDLGAEVSSGYGGDMTRTLSIGGFDGRQKELYQIVHDAQRKAIEALAPGVLFLDVHKLACRTLVEGLSAMGLMKGDSESAVEAGAHSLFFQCGLGHMMGLDVHDMESLGESYVGYTESLKQSSEFGLKSLRLGRELEEGFVVTVEPGLYFIPVLFEQWKSTRLHEAFINYDATEKFMDSGGIRIEDDLLITSKGSRVLGEPLASDISSVVVD